MELGLKNRILLLVSITSLCIVSDQVTKVWAQRELAYEYSPGKFFPQHEITVIPKVLNLIYKENAAAAFSLTSSVPEWFRKPFLITVSIIAGLFFLIWYFRLKNPHWFMLTSFSLIIAGAVGNLIDRVRLGYVIDFLDVYAGFLGYSGLHWPTFNIADSCIVVGAFGILLESLYSKRA
ncbi:MAG: signal peptidase II [Deltaproteobacteria bacterium]|nr:signal peptidase II [Deltaproteobacteria bacterium]